MPTDIYGQIEVAYFQLTPQGLQAAESSQRRRGLDPGTRALLQEFVRYGGTMEWDEIKLLGTTNAPTAAGVGLRRLIDLGYVKTITLPEG